MILSASRRTDIPAFYSDWFVNRLQEGFVLVRNPMSYHQVSRVSLDPDLVDCIVFWTKNPAPLIGRLADIENMGYAYYFQFTLTPYGRDIEARLPGKKRLLETFQALSARCGPEKAIWRYDPILVGEVWSVDCHLEKFSKMAALLRGHTEKCVFSFYDEYSKVAKAVQSLNLRAPDTNEMNRLAEGFSRIAAEQGIRLESCAEELALERFGIKHARCIDDRLVERILGCSLNVKKDANQRASCGCVSSIDVGAFNTCIHDCAYCYANFNKTMARRNHAAYDAKAALLCGVLGGDDKVIPRKDKDLRSLKARQISLFDGM